MNWEKKGLIFTPDRKKNWMQSHATTPVPLHLEGNIYRIFFATRNELNQNQLGFVDLDITNPNEALNISDEPALRVGKLGYFDCDGVYPTCIFKHEEKLYAYYGGWNAGLRGLFYSAIGLAVSTNNGLSFERVSEAPILGRDEIDKWATMAPFVIVDGDIWRMWYASGIELRLVDGKLKSMYDVKYAESDDGINWQKTGISSFDLGKNDTNIARVCVYKEDNLYKGWYPVVGRDSGLYRIGYGESKDGVRFERMDHLVTIATSETGWDSEAITYPYVFKHQDRYYMLYNGNGFGRDGFGLAVSEE